MFRQYLLAFIKEFTFLNHFKYLPMEEKITRVNITFVMSLLLLFLFFTKKEKNFIEM